MGRGNLRDLAPGSPPGRMTLLVALHRALRRVRSCTLRPVSPPTVSAGPARAGAARVCVEPPRSRARRDPRARQRAISRSLAREPAPAQASARRSSGHSLTSGAASIRAALEPVPSACADHVDADNADSGRGQCRALRRTGSNLACSGRGGHSGRSRAQPRSPLRGQRARDPVIVGFCRRRPRPAPDPGTG